MDCEFSANTVEVNKTGGDFGLVMTTPVLEVLVWVIKKLCTESAVHFVMHGMRHKRNVMAHRPGLFEEDS